MCGTRRTTSKCFPLEPSATAPSTKVPRECDSHTQILLEERVLVLGNSGAGKSTLAGAISQTIGMPVFELDAFHWASGYVQKRNDSEARRLVADAASAPRWVIEGVFGWLIDVAIPQATTLIWLDLSWQECRAGLLARGRETVGPRRTSTISGPGPKTIGKGEHQALLKGIAASTRLLPELSFAFVVGAKSTTSLPRSAQRYRVGRFQN